LRGFNARYEKPDASCSSAGLLRRSSEGSVCVKFGSTEEKERRAVKIQNIHENESDSPRGGHRAQCEPPIRLRACALLRLRCRQVAVPDSAAECLRPSVVRCNFGDHDAQECKDDGGRSDRGRGVQRIVNEAITCEVFPNAGPALNRCIQMACGRVQILSHCVAKSVRCCTVAAPKRLRVVSCRLSFRR
jgi:hypothetical protein